MSEVRDLRELNVQISAFMGYREGKDGHWEIGTKGQDDYGSYWPGPIPYSSDYNYCAQAEQRIMKMGLGEEYARALSDALEMPSGQSFTLSLLTASAETRCRAMLVVLAAEATLTLPTERQIQRALGEVGRDPE